VPAMCTASFILVASVYVKFDFKELTGNGN